MAAISVEEVQQIIHGEDDSNEIGAEIHRLATELDALDGQVPTTKEQLKGLGLSDYIVALLLNHVFGSAELLIGMHARKILTALDMVDWEGMSGAKKKSDVKMTQISDSRVANSLMTWLPRGEKGLFHDTMTSIGNLISCQKKGDWGRIRTSVNKHFATKEKETLLAMLEKINQFYKSTRK